MSTPCAIGIELPDGKVKAVRCHWDGYVAGAGAVLGGWYTDAAKVEALLKLGELATVEPELDKCEAYHRDYGAKLKRPVRFKNIEDYRYNGRGKLNACYLYIYRNGKWYVFGVAGTEWMELNVIIGEE